APGAALGLHLREPAFHRHPDGGQGGGGELHDQLHFHHHGVAVDLAVDPLHDGEVEGEEQPGADGGEESDEVVGAGEAGGLVAAGAEAEEDGAGDQEDDAVEVGECDLLPDDEDGEKEGEGELGGEEEG
ncbi:hypothetical protein TorRG33x02_203650, partial [Trema orientale]